MMVGFMVVVTCSVAMYIGDEGELTHAMAAARTGASEGMIADSVAVYSDTSFDGIVQQNPRLINPSSVKIVKIDYEDRGLNRTYNRTLITLRIHATGPTMNSYEQRSFGDRINYNARRSICDVFGTQNLTDFYFDPAFSNRYMYVTDPVVWV